jgi:hypothetical protein
MAMASPSPKWLLGFAVFTSPSPPLRLKPATATSTSTSQLFWQLVVGWWLVESQRARARACQSALHPPWTHLPQRQQPTSAVAPKPHIYTRATTYAIWFLDIMRTPRPLALALDSPLEVRSGRWAGEVRSAGAGTARRPRRPCIPRVLCVLRAACCVRA